VPFPRIKLNGKAADITSEVRRAARTSDRGKTHEHRRLDCRVPEKVGPGVFGHRFINLKLAVSSRATCVHHALRNSLVIEVRNLLAQNEIFEQGRAAISR